MAQLLKQTALMVLLVGNLAYAEEIINDPTRPPANLLQASSPAASAPASALVLQTILRSPSRKMAIINGQTLKLGQSIQGYRLLRLETRRATLQGPDGKLVLDLISQPSSSLKNNNQPPHPQGDSQ